MYKPITKMLTAKLAPNQLKSASKVYRNPVRISLEPEPGPRRNWRENIAGTGAWTKAELEGESRWNRSRNVGKIQPKPDAKPVSEPKPKPGRNPARTGTQAGTGTQTVTKMESGQNRGRNPGRLKY